MVSELVVKKKKICFISLKAYQLFNQKVEGTFGGAEVQMSYLAKELAKDEKYQISFIVGDYGQKDKEERDGVFLYKFLSPRAKGVSFIEVAQLFKLYQLLRKLDADIYITTTAHPVIGLVSFFSMINNKKHLHRTSSDIGVDGSFIARGGFLGKMYKFGLKRADQILVQNELNKEMLYKNHKLDSIVLKNVFILSGRKNAQKKEILWVSRSAAIKKPQKFLDLAERFPGETFRMICPSSVGQESVYRKAKLRAFKIKNVKFVDFVPFDKIQEYYDHAKVFINTSDYEGFPNTFIQSCISGTPILSLNVNPDNFLNEYNCGYCANSNFEQMCDYLKEITKDYRKWRIKSNNSRKYVEENHDIKINIERFKEILENTK